MDVTARIDAFMSDALTDVEATPCPDGLARAMRHAVFPGGARIRPRLSIAVAHACGETDLALPLAAASAIEFLHCASLVHDDLPCFDNADIRRGKPAVHKAFGEPLAILAGDALIVLAFEILARSGAERPARLASLIRIVGGAVGPSGGIVAGQAWESEPVIDTAHYHRSKTGALFAGATMAGAAATGSDWRAWRQLGEGLGEAFQAADDIRDIACTEAELGKPVGQDAVCDRPNIASELGVSAAIRHLDDLVACAVDAIPPCPGSEDLRRLILRETQRFLPEGLALRAA